MTIDVEVSRAAVLFPAHCVGEFAQRVRSSVGKGEAVFESQTLAAQPFRELNRKVSNRVKSSSIDVLMKLHYQMS